MSNYFFRAVSPGLGADVLHLGEDYRTRDGPKESARTFENIKLGSFNVQLYEIYPCQAQFERGCIEGDDIYWDWPSLGLDCGGTKAVAAIFAALDDV